MKLPTKYSDFLKFAQAFIFFFNQDIEKIYEFDIQNHSVVDRRYGKISLVIYVEEYIFTDEQWEKIKSHLPKRETGRPFLVIGKKFTSVFFAGQKKVFLKIFFLNLFFLN